MDMSCFRRLSMDQQFLAENTRVQCGSLQRSGFASRVDKTVFIFFSIFLINCLLIASQQ